MPKMTLRKLVTRIAPYLDLVALFRQIQVSPQLLTSEVPGNEGPCVVAWISESRAGAERYFGLCGFFRKARPLGMGLWFVHRGDFHGLIPRNGRPVVLEVK